MNDERMTFADAFGAVLHKWWLVLVFTLVATGVSWYVTNHVIDPLYESEVNILVASKQTDESPVLSTGIDDSLKLINTYSDILTSNYILKSAEKNLAADGHDLKIDPDHLTISNIENSQVITLTVSSGHATEAALIADAMATSFDQKVQHIMGLKHKNAKVLNKPSVNHDPVFPDPLLIISLTFLLAFMFSVWLCVFIHAVKKQKK